MNRLNSLFNQNKTYFLCFFTWFFLLSSLVLCYPRLESFQFINSRHVSFFDYFFTIITQYGDGIFVLALGLVLFIRKSRRMGTAIILTYVGSGLICSIIKRYFHAYRPAHFLKEDPSFHAVSWLDLAHNNSFPSGHTTSAFALATTICLFSTNKKWGLLALVCACLTGYSRMYLGQHFMDDVWFGSLLGTVFSLAYALSLSYFAEKPIKVSNFMPPNFKI